MQKIINQTILILFTLGAVFLLCSIFNARSELAYGMISGKIYVFRQALLFFAGCVVLMEATALKSKFTFALPDGLLIILFGCILLSYDKVLNLQPQKILFLGQITLLWFMLRATLQVFPRLRMLFLCVMVFMGIFTSAWSLTHFYGDISEGKSIFSEIDFAFNSRLIAGYLSVLLPICVNLIMRFRRYRKFPVWRAETQLYYLAGTAFFLILLALIACGDRPSGIAALLSSVWTGWMCLTGWERTKHAIRRYRISFALSTLVLFVFVTGLPQVGNTLKVGSADQRILMWNVTTKAILEHPFRGGGIGSYPVLYAKTQGAYFASGEASKREKMAACFPSFALNEYLHIGLELGITGLLLFLLWVGFSLYYGICHRQMGACGGILALAVLAMYTYPLQLPSFWILLVFLSVVCVTEVADNHLLAQQSFPYIGAFAAIVYCIVCWVQEDSYQAYREWKTLERVYEKGDYRVAVKGYTCLFGELCHRSEFLKQGARCLYETGQYQQADVWLERALLLSADPEIYYLKADNNRCMKRYHEAERCLQDIIGILPERAQSYFQLAKLYADSAYFRPDKLEEMIRVITRKRLQTQTKGWQELGMKLKGTDGSVR